MLKKVKKARFIESGVLATKYQFCSGTKISELKLSKSRYNSLLQIQVSNPVSIMTEQKKGKNWWMFQGEFYWENEGLSADEVKALVFERSGRRDENE